MSSYSICLLCLVYFTWHLPSSFIHLVVNHSWFSSFFPFPLRPSRFQVEGALLVGPRVKSSGTELGSKCIRHAERMMGTQAFPAVNHSGLALSVILAYPGWSFRHTHMNILPPISYKIRAQCPQCDIQETLKFVLRSLPQFTSPASLSWDPLCLIHT